MGAMQTARTASGVTEQYTGRPHYYGAIYPDTQRRYETRVIARIHPRRIVCDAIHR
jgi:hypothetical protein